MKHLFICLTLLCMMHTSAVYAERVTGQLPNGLWVNAEYQTAEQGKPTVLLIHPLQQTNQFATIANLADSLADNDYGVLSPNLSLGISNRQRGMACEAIHAHGYTQDAQEVGFWVDWLADKVQSPIIAIGYSTGALQILAYPDAEKLSAMVLLSIIPVTPHAIDPQQLKAALQAKAAGEPDTLMRFRFRYCQNYVTPRDTYLDTATWDEDKVSQRLNGLKLTTDIILGDDDYRLNKPWLEKIDNKLTRTHLISGANHFFSGPEEFDLHDKILEILESTP